MILHGIYDKGKIKITDKDLPDVKCKVEIELKIKPWNRNVKKVKIKGKPVSEVIVDDRYEE